MNQLQGLGPVVDDRTRVLVLGTIPGAVSLELQRYYAHAGRRFWRLIQEIVGVPADATYEERVRKLLDASVGLWDTLAACDREGSLDANIRNAAPNDFERLLTAHPAISVIALNGKKAADVFRRTILPTLPTPIQALLTVLDLPSTSPANARGGFEALLVEWSVLTRWTNPSAVDATEGPTRR